MGRQLAQDQDLIKEMVSTHDPDYLLVLLGFNDMGWFISDAGGKLYISRYSFLEAVSHLTSSQVLFSAWRISSPKLEP